MTTDILLSQRFLPEHGGSIRWMYEVYRRWPAPVRVITHDYYSAPPRTAEFPGAPGTPGGPDCVTDENLTMDRRDIFMRDWGLESFDRIRRYRRMTRAVHEVFKTTKDVVRVHCTHAVPEVVSLLAMRRKYGNRLRVICYAHGEEITACCSSRQLRFLMRRAHRIVDLMLANSHYTAGLLRDHIDEQKVRVVHPGVQLDEFTDASGAGARLRAERGWQDRLIVLTLGRLDPRKNHAAVIDAVAELPDVVYVIAGEGREMQNLKAQARQRGIEDRVVFTGAVDGPTRIALYGTCDVFAMPAVRDGTDVEGFGMVFLEAAACGKPSICGNTGGQADAVKDGNTGGETGLVVDGADRGAVTSALRRLTTDKNLRDQLGANGLAHAQQFDWSAVVQRTVELVENIQ